MKSRLLVISPTFESVLINLITFLKKNDTKYTFFIAPVSGNVNIEKEYNDFILNQEWCFVPNNYLLPMDENLCIARIKYHTSYNEQALIYKRFFPDIYLHTYENIHNIICKINPEYIITSFGSLYIYNVLCANFVKKIFPNERILIYKDYPYINYLQYKCNNKINDLCLAEKLKTCPRCIQQKLFVLNKWFPKMLEVFPKIVSCQETIYKYGETK